MARPLINRSGEMAVFVSVVEQRSLSRAARASQMTPSAVSKLVSRLEARLGVQLISRSTRAFQLTSEGCLFYERAIRILADIEEAERSAGTSKISAERIKLSASASYITHVLAPVLPDFLSQYPGIRLELEQSDAVIDLVNERADIAVRTGPLKDSSLIAQKLGQSWHVIAAAPAYLSRFGEPMTIEDLETHYRLGPSYLRAIEDWPLMSKCGPVLIQVKHRVQANDGEALRQFALSDAGLIRAPLFTLRGDIAAGRIVPVLEHLNPGDHGEFHAIFAGQAHLLPGRVRALIDFLVQNGRVT